MHVDLKFFLRSGQIGSIAVGMSRQELKAILGEPDKWGSHADKAKATIWKYGSLEFHFPQHGDRLWMIFTDNLSPIEGSRNLILDSWILSDQLRLEAAKSSLADEKIIYNEVVQPKIGAIELVLASGVKLRFYPRDEDKQYVLSSLSIIDTN